MESSNMSVEKKPGRRSMKLKNLEEEVELIFSQDENDEKSDNDMDPLEILPTTPTTKNRKHVATPKASGAVLEEILQTPRRSCRKSVKPTQEYEEIVNKSLRSTRSAKKIFEDTEDKEKENLEPKTDAPRWTPAKVGRVSQKRGRKSKRGGRGKKHDTETTQLCDETIIEVECDEIAKTVEILKNKENLEKIVEQKEIDRVESDAKQMKFVDNTTDVKVENLNRKFVSYEIEKSIEQIDIDQNEKDTKQIKSDDNIVEVNAEDQMENCNRTFESHEVEKIKEQNDTEQVENDNATFENKEIEKDSIIIRHKTDNENDKTSKEVHELETGDMDSDSIHLMQEDSEDCNKFTENAEREEICIIYENNISNKNITDIESPSPKRSLQGKKDSFGSYLKTKEINISDLGLNPLKDEVEEKDVYCSKSSFDETEEMSSLIICDDEVQNTESDKLNETFEANERDVKHNGGDMESLQLSDDDDDDDDGERPRKRVRIALAVNDMENHILSTPKVCTSKVKLSSTPKPFAALKQCVTPKQSAKPFRFPTPYRTKQSFNFNVDKETASKTPSKTTSKPPKIFVTTLEPKEIVLRGIRKRSLSVCIETNNLNRKKPERVVSFYSPANETAIIDDIDLLLASNIKKPKSPQKPSNKFITTRRKRSISLDESRNFSSLASKLPRPQPGQIPGAIKAHTSSSSTSKAQIRTKLPNFAAIHEKQFKKMENLVDHVNRKQERSKNLLNSSTKLKSASAQKHASVVKNSNNVPAAKTKASKKIDMSQSKSLNTTNASTHAAGAKVARELPDPRLGVSKLAKFGTTSSKLPQQQQQTNKYLKPSQTSNIEKPQSNMKTLAPSKTMFNLSTSVMAKPLVPSSHSQERANVSHMSHEDKMASRLQRHMDLFKGRAAATRSAGTITQKNEVILKGVRSNRRFELQMKHRKNMEQ